MNAHVRSLGDGGAQCWSHKSSLSVELRAQTRRDRRQQQNIRRREGGDSCAFQSEVKAENKVQKEEIQAGSPTLQAGEGCLQTAWKGKMTVT